MAFPGFLAAQAPGHPRELRLLHRISLPRTHSVPTDIRWASDDSAYVSWESDGVAERNLDGTKRRGWVPDLKTLGGIDHYSHLAVSSGILAVSSELHSLVWRPLKAAVDGRFPVHRQEFRMTQDFDLSGDRILLLGDARHERTFSPKAEVAWIGTLAANLGDLKPLLRDAGGAGAPNFHNCGSYQMGAVRFLGDGSFLVVPGFQDGIHLFDAGGRQVRSWSNEQVGVDSHVGCGTMSAEEERRFRVDDADLSRWIESHHLVDDILPLPQGPGLLVRSWGADGRAHWTLKVLQSEGVKTYVVPVVGRRPFDRLHGDVRNGRIILLLSNSGYPYSKSPEDLTAEILTMEQPDHPHVY